MRLFSNEESAKNGEPSLVAIVETLIAVGFSFSIGVTYGTWWHVFIAACVAPLLLLRTDESSRAGIELYAKCMDAVEPFGNRLNAPLRRLALAPMLVQLPISLVLLFLMPTLLFCWLLLAVLISKSTATFTFLVRDFVKQLAAIPTNFWKITVATDFLVSPLLMPLPDTLRPEEANYRNFAAYRFPEVIQSSFFKPQPSNVTRSLATLKPIIYLFMGITIGVCFAYRFSVKATSIVWFPLLWALKPVRKDGRSWETQLRVYWDQKGPQIVAVFSSISIALFALKYALWAIRFKLADFIDEARQVRGLSEWLQAIIRPEAIPIWHIAIAVNSLLGLYFWWQVANWLVEYNHNSGPSEPHVTKVVAVTFFVRRLLTSYTIIWNVFIIYNVAKLLPVPEIGWQLFPWV
ncbi:MAG: hypothetical protein JWN70_5679 [Planctomycetaceae bacterium]|nr:hypothetical protein [Planctomycetaceae bacterium]